MAVTETSEFNGDERANGFFIVGIGASAGGIQALKEFFKNVPSHSGMAYVVILHLSPDHDSKLAEILQTTASIPVSQVTQSTRIEPDQIYVVPPNQHLVLLDGSISANINVRIEERRAPVDIFFRNLADIYGPRAVCVVLSGTGANGSMGLKRVKERGGVAYVQNPDEAQYNEMPRNSIATGLVDEVLPVGEIPQHIISYRDNISSVELVEETEKRPETQQQALREIFTQLRVSTGHDFSNYKRPTMLRRIERRVNLRGLPDLPSFASFLNKNTDETHALLKDLLISVTNFFRDKKAFEVLERDVLPRIMSGKTSEDQVRIWVAGCATGEEAYSIAMLCSELTLGLIDAPKVQIFATDIDEAAITIAREGRYTLNDAADVSPERLRRFFSDDGNGYRVRREIRETILFANHNFLKDPPFSRLDLISCRNVLIYLNSTAQERVIETFHFALRPKSFLFLGTSESIDGATDIYASFHRESHIFQTREVLARMFPVPDSVPNFQINEVNWQEKPQLRETLPQRISFGDLHQRLLEQYAPPSVVVNEEYDIVHMTETVGKYFEFAGGEPTQNLLKLIRPEIRLELRSALYQAVQNKTAVESRSINVTLNGQPRSLDLHIRPVLEEGDTAKGFILVLFRETQRETEDQENVMRASDEPVARQLEDELIRLKTQLRTSIEQHEFQAEELKASNEELQAMNEELRSAAEELETSKEELQSINEELRTVNQELKVKIDETSLVSNNLQNLINSADVGTIFLDRNFCIQLFTPAVLSIFNLKLADYGRPISDITHKLEYNDLLAEAQSVLNKLIILEREVTSIDHRFYMMRLLPYRTSDDRINGVVITFFDITKRKQSEEALREVQEKYRTQLEEEVEQRTAELKENKELLQTVFDVSPNSISVYEALYSNDGTIEDFRILMFNLFTQKTTGRSDVVGQRYSDVFPHVIENGILDAFKRVILTGEPTDFEVWYAGEGMQHWFRIKANKVGNLLVVTTEDITESKLAQKKILEEHRRLKEAQSIGLIGSFEWNIGERVVAWSDEMYRICELEPQSMEATVELSESTIVSEDLPAVLALKAVSFSKPGHYEIQHRILLHNGISKWVTHRFQSIADATGKVVRVHGTLQDITQQKVTEQQIFELKDALTQRATNKYLTLMSNMDQGFCILEVVFDKDENPVDYVFLEINPAFQKQTILGNPVGSRMRELAPGHEEEWFQLYGKVVKTGQPVHVTMEANYIGGFVYEVYATPIGDPGRNQVAVLFDDVTKRTREESNSAFLAEISQCLVEMGDPLELIRDVSGRIASHFNASICAFMEVDEKGEKVDVIHDWHRSGLASLAGTYQLSEYLSKDLIAKYKANETLIIDNIAQTLGINREKSAYLEIASGISVPYLRQKELVYILAIYDTASRKWRNDEIVLLRELSVRIWTRLESAKAEEALRKSESRLKRMVNVPQVGVLTFDYTGKMLHANDAFLTMVGYIREEFESGHFTWREFTPPEHLDASESIMEQLVNTGIGGPYEKEYFKKDGSKIWMMFVAADLGDGTLIEYALDISDRKKAELLLQQFNEQLDGQVKDRTASLKKTTDELQNSLAILQQAEALAQIGSWEYHFNTRAFTWSDGMYYLFGFPEKIEVEPEVYVQMAVDEDKDMAGKITESIREGVLPLPETVCIKVGDTIRVLKIEATIVKDADGNPSRMIGVDLDITNARQAAKTLREQAHFIQSTNDALPDILFVMDLESKGIIYINHSFEERLGFDAAQSNEVGRSILDLVYEEDVPVMLAHFQDMKNAKDGEVCEVEYRIVAADGSLHWFRDRNAIFKRNKAGLPTEKIGIAQDITESKKADQALKEINTSLRYANEHLQQFASIASHDLQEPLRKLRLFSTILQRFKNELPDEGKELLRKIGVTAERMSQLIREVLQFSKIAYGANEFVPTNLHQILLNVLVDLELLLSETGTRIIYNNDLPEIEAIPLQMNQLIYNLLTNAIKFRREGVKPTIEISITPLSSDETRNQTDLKSDRAYVEIVVSDNGIGFDEQFSEQIFQIFERLHSVDEFEGTGVGLALCKKIIENHAGRIYAISNEGEGAAFHILLPLTQ